MRNQRMQHITMSYIKKQKNTYGISGLQCIATFCRTSKPNWCILTATLCTFVLLFHHAHYLSYSKLSEAFSNEDDSNSVMADGNVENEPIQTEEVNTNETVIEMSDRVPSFELATKKGDRPSSESDRAYGKLLDELHLQDVCQQDPTTIVVDVGAGLGEFGLYAAACGCTVYMFEVRTDLVTLIKSSIKHNSFTSPPVDVFQKAVSDVPTDSTIDYSPPEGEGDNTDTFTTVQTIRLDDVSWSSLSIYILKIDTPGSELNVLRSAKTLFNQKRIRYLFFDYSPWLGDPELQKSILSYVRRDAKAKFIYNIYRKDEKIYGPLVPMHFPTLYDRMVESRTNTSIYAVFDNRVTRSSIKSEPFPINNR
ncbi:hypothetical protein I4U23_019766 [Adineta vaga]|nr:hypothetical protein I4U23_019766 [Adineta vaga]